MITKIGCMTSSVGNLKLACEEAVRAYRNTYHRDPDEVLISEKLPVENRIPQVYGIPVIPVRYIQDWSAYACRKVDV